MYVSLCFDASALGLLTVLQDDPEIYHGAPVGVQLVARKFEEEKILAIAGVAVEALKAVRTK